MNADYFDLIKEIQRYFEIALYWILFKKINCINLNVHLSFIEIIVVCDIMKEIIKL